MSAADTHLSKHWSDGRHPHFPRWSNGTLVCEAEIRETSCRPVRSEDETLAGAPLCSLRLTFLSLSTREIALGEVLPACWIREAGVEATGSAALRSRLAVAPVGGPGGRARAAEPRSCPILSSRSCSRRSRSTSSGFRAAPCRNARRDAGQPREATVLWAPAPSQDRAAGAGEHILGTVWSNRIPTERETTTGEGWR